MKKLVLFVAVSSIFVLAMAPAAFANFGIHGGYMQDTDACAGCHRAHTAFADLSWTGSDSNQHNALLVSGAQSMSEFCYTCHGNGAPGAATNVQGGVLDTAIFGDSQAGPDQVGNVLNGGGFDTLAFGTPNQRQARSSHSLETSGSRMWGSNNRGAGTSPNTYSLLSCNSCHDVHGSSNYRILLDSVNGYTVGGYQSFNGSGNTVANPLPQPWVLSAEIGYPNGTNGSTDIGFRLHKAYKGQIAGEPAYQPDYTNAVYSVPPGGDSLSGAPMTPAVNKGMSGWCIACHETYGSKGNATNQPGDVAYSVGGADDSGSKVRHLHPVNAALSNFTGPRGVVVDPNTWYTGWQALKTAGQVTEAAKFVDLPLLHDPSREAEGRRYSVDSTGNVTNTNSGVTYTSDDAVDCLTCHRAHGTDTIMTGYANSASNAHPAKDTGIGGVQPTNDSALLRANNRGVCERCHNK